VTHPDIRWRRNDIKATSLAANCMAAQYAYEHGCPEVIFISPDGLLTEGSHTSIFAVKDGKLLVAPASANVLPGITKKVVLELAKSGNIPLADAKIKKEEIHLLDEMFMAGTPEEVIAITTVDGKPIGSGQCGPVVKKLQSEYKKLIAESLA
jgi:D-alanine transaminase